MRRRDVKGEIGLTRREALAAAMSVPVAALLGRSTPAVERSLLQSQPGSEPSAVLAVTMLVEGGVLWLDKAEGGVKVGYANGDGSCHVPAHKLLLMILKGPAPVVDGSIGSPPWNLDGLTVTFTTGSARKPKPDRWRPTPMKPNTTEEWEHPEQPTDLAELDWIPTVASAASDWSRHATSQLIVPTGEWNAEDARDSGKYGRDIWRVERRQGGKLRQQYVTDVVRWEDDARQALVISFTRGGASIGTATFKAPGQLALAVASDVHAGTIAVGGEVAHYCQYDPLFADTSKLLTLRRTNGCYSVERRSALGPSRLGTIPGKFCPGGKIVG